MNAKELSNDELALILRTINTTGIAPTRFEMECIEEGACRIEYLERVSQRIHSILQSMEGKK